MSLSLHLLLLTTFLSCSSGVFRGSAQPSQWQSGYENPFAVGMTNMQKFKPSFDLPADAFSASQFTSPVNFNVSNNFVESSLERPFSNSYEQQEQFYVNPGSKKDHPPQNNFDYYENNFYGDNNIEYSDQRDDYYDENGFQDSGHRLSYPKPQYEHPHDFQYGPVPNNYEEEEKVELVPRQTEAFLSALGTLEKALEFKMSLFSASVEELFTTTLPSTSNTATSFSTASIFNSSSFLIIGVLVVAAILLFPAIGGSLGLTNARNEKSIVNDESLLDSLYRQLADIDIDGETCANMVVCSTIKRISNSASRRKANPTEKIISGFMSSGPVENLLKGSRFAGAIQDGSKRSDCEEIYENCPFSIKMVEAMVNEWVISKIPIKSLINL